jgi:class 3 adenylate cyclase
MAGCDNAVRTDGLPDEPWAAGERPGVTVHIHLLGQVGLESGEEVVPASALPGRQGRMAFAYLVLARHPVSRDEVAELIWPDELPKSWERDLSAIISKLKALLARAGMPNAVRSALGCYELVLPLDAMIDVEAARSHIEDAETALRRDEPAAAWGAASSAYNLATRPFLPGESGEWVESKRSELTKIAVRAADALVIIESSRDRWAEAARYAEEATKREPFRESGYVALIDVHLAAGNRAEALRAYERARMLLVEELGVPPSTTLEAAYRRALDADAPADVPAVPVTGTVSLVFTDLVGSTELADRLGAEESEVVRRSHFRLLRDAVATTGGHEVKNLGDGLMIAFARARDALSCAVAMQEAVDRRNRTESGPALAVRVGVHVGEPVIDEGDYFGMPVVIAKRLCDIAGAAEIVASELVCTLADASDGFDLGPVAEVELKGLEHPVAARRVAWTPIVDAPLALPAVAGAVDDDHEFVGREQELAAILSHLPSGAVLPRLVLVAGEPGVGKTRLLVEAARRAYDKGTTVLWGRCSEDTLAAYQPFVEALDHVVAASPLHELRALTGQGTADLALLVPRLAERLPTRRDATDEPDRRVLFDAAASCLAALAARRPLMVVIDDLHWADGPTAQLLVHLMSTADPLALVFVASVRSVRSDWSPAASDAHADLIRTERLTRIDLQGLAGQEVTALLGMNDARMHPEGFALARSLHAATAGNPFFVREIVRHLEETGRLEVRDGRWSVHDPYQPLDVPTGVVAVVARRVGRLNEEARELLTLASVIGIEFDLDVLVELTGDAEDAVLDHLDRALDAQVVVESPGAPDRFAFTHALVREAVHLDIGASRRLRLHKRVAEALERIAGDSRIAEIAHHWCVAGAAGDLTRAVDYARRAGEAAMTQLAYEAAAQHFAAALDALRQQGERDPHEQLDLLLALGDARARGADPRAADTFRAAADIARGAADAVGFAHAVSGLTSEWILTGVVDDERIGLVEEAIDLLGPDDRPERAALLGHLAGELYYMPGTGDRRDALSAEAVAVARRVGDPVALGNALDHRNYAMWGPGGAGDRADAGREIVALAREAGSLELELRGHDWVMIGAGVQGDLRLHDDALIAFARVADELRRPRNQWYARTRRAGRTVLAGDLDEGARLARSALAEGFRLGEADALGVYTGAMWAYWLERPDHEGVQAQTDILDRYAVVDGSPEDSLPFLIHRAMRAVLLALVGECDRAIVDYDWYREYGFASIRRDYGWGPSVSTLARAITLLGPPEDAELLYAEIAPFDGEMVAAAGSLWCGAWSHHLGSLAAHMERWDAATRHFESAVAMYERAEAKAYLARAQLELGKALGRVGDRRGAEELLASAGEAAARLGLPLIAAEIATSSP